MMRIFLIYILSLFLSPLVQGADAADPLTKNAIDQVNYLLERNKKIDQGTLDEKKWFIYFLGNTVDDLEYILQESSIVNDSQQYLERLNSELAIINSGDSAAVYVAMTDYDTPIVVPLLPSGGTVQDKISNLKSIINDDDNFENIINTNINPENIQIAIDGFEDYKKYFFKVSNDIYELSNLQSQYPGKKIILPMQFFHIVTINNIPSTFYSSTVKSSSIEENEKQTFDDIRNALVAPYGEKTHQKSLAKTIEAYKFYLNGDYELLLEGGFKKEIGINSELSSRSNDLSISADTSFDISKHIIDLAGIFTDSEKQNLLSEIDFNRTVIAGMNVRIVITDDSTPSDIQSSVSSFDPNENRQEYLIWIHLKKGINGESDEVTVKNIVHDDFNAKIKQATQHWTESIWDDLALNFGEGTVDFMKAQLASSNQLLHLVSDLLGATQVPEKYWNPSHTEYPSYMPYIAGAINVSMGDLSTVFSTQTSQMQFAFKCGLWNGLINEVKGIADLGVMATDYILFPQKAEEFDSGLSQLSIDAIWNSFQQAHGYEEGGETNQFKLSEQLGQDVIFVASMFIGVGEVTAFAKTGKLPKIALVTTKLTQGAVALIKQLPEALRVFAQKLPQQITKDISSGFLILKTNTTQIARITDEGVIFSVKWMDEGKVVKLTDNEISYLNNTSYIDNTVNDVLEGTLVIVENGNQAGLKFINTTAELSSLEHFAMASLTRTTTSGIVIGKRAGKTVTILGKYDLDISKILKELDYPKTRDFGPKRDRYNVLNVPDNLYETAEQFWLQFNKEFLDAAILRGDDIVLATNPTQATLNLFDDAGSMLGRSGFGREYDYLLSKGYVFDDVTKKMVNEVGDVIYRADFVEHLIDVKGFTQRRAVSGGHNLDNFNNYLSSNNIQINRISTSNGSVDGISELTYQIQKADGSGGWKSTQFKKTHYDPSKISDIQMTDFGKEAMNEGLKANRTVIQQGSNTIIKGESTNGIKFLGYQDPTTGEILNFHPVINY